MRKYNDDEIADYIKNWYQDDKTTDFEIAFDTGYLDICIHFLCGAGVFESGESEIENQIMSECIDLDEWKRQIDECYKGCIIMTNPDTNETWWIPSPECGVDYFVDENECIKMGYTEKSKFDKE